MQSLENQTWRSWLAISTKLKLYNTCILPIFLYGSDCWAISKTDACKIDALDQWCLRMLLGIKWYQVIRNDDVRRLTKQPKLTAIILFGYIMRMDDNADAKRILLASPLADWKRQLGRPRIMWLSTVQQTSSSTEPPSVEDDVDVWRYTILELHARNDDDSSAATVPASYNLMWHYNYICRLRLTSALNLAYNAKNCAVWHNV